MLLDAVTFDNLDDKEGYPDIYGRSEHRLNLGTGGGGGSEEAWGYTVTPAHRQPRHVPPLRGYRQLMLDAAKEYGFGADYIRDLMQVDVVD